MRKFDYTTLRECQWDSEILGLVAQIHEFKGRQELYLRQKPAVLDKLVEIAKVQSTEASNKIEGIVTTETRIHQLCMDKTTPRNRDEEEIMGYRDVLNTIHESYKYIPIRSSYILQLHRELYKYSEKAIGGRYKNTQNVIAETREDGTQIVRFTPMAPYETPDAIEEICESFNQVIDSCLVDPLVLIPIFINDFLCIHPFNDGNGRMSRLLTLLLLYRSGYIVGKYISIEKMIETTKETYYEALQASSVGWHEGKNDYSSFINYMLGVIVASYREFSSRVKLLTTSGLTKGDRIGEIIKQTVGTITKTEIMNKCPDISQITIQRALIALQEQGKIIKIGGGRYTKYTWNWDK